jgi:dephospho-CoA kinase
VVGISGRTGSGKSTAALILAHKGYTSLSTRAVLTRELVQRGETVSRAALQKLGGEVNRTFGQGWLLGRVATDVEENGHFVVDGLRFPEDHRYFEENYGDSYFHLHVEAPRELRLARFVNRGGTQEEFESAERDITEAHAEEMRQLSTHVIENVGAQSQLEDQTITVVDAWGGE